MNDYQICKNCGTSFPESVNRCPKCYTALPEKPKFSKGESAIAVILIIIILFLRYLKLI